MWRKNRIYFVKTSTLPPLFMLFRAFLLLFAQKSIIFAPNLGSFASLESSI